MPTVVGVRFKDSGKIYHFDPQDVPLLVGDWAVVETSRGPEMGRIAAASSQIPPEDVVGELRPVIRRAGDEDWASLRHYEQYLDEALAICAEKVREQRLPMHMIKAEYGFDGSRLTFFFTSDKRVDFRVLVRDLARTFHTRIELRQVGPRDEAKLLGGMGPCGRPLCCSTFLPEFAQVSIKMAKDQDLPLNPTKVSGVCGKLLCCLSYEQEQYLEIKAELPQRGTWVQTPEGPGEVVAVNVVRENVTVQLMTGASGNYSRDQIAAVTEQVALEARRRNAAGITPATRIDTGADEMLDREVLDVLAQLEDSPAPPASVPAPSPRNPALRPEMTIAPTGNRGRLGRPAPTDRAVPPPTEPQRGQRSTQRSAPPARTSADDASRQRPQTGRPEARLKQRPGAPKPSTEARSRPAQRRPAERPTVKPTPEGTSAEATAQTTPQVRAQGPRVTPPANGGAPQAGNPAPTDPTRRRRHKRNRGE